MARQQAQADKNHKSLGKNASIQEIQEEIAFLRQRCNSMSIRGNYAECVKTIEENLPLFWRGERWPENFFAILRLHQKCFPSLRKDQTIDEYMAALLKKLDIPFVLGRMLLSPDSSFQWTTDFFKDRVAECRGEGDYETALSYCDLVLKIDPGSSSAYLLKGWVYDDMGDGTNAVAMYKLALELNKGNRYALNSLAQHYLKGDPKRALEFINQALEAHPEEASFHASKSDILRGMGDRDGALVAVQDAINNDPYNPEYPYKKAEIFMEQNKAGAAVPQYRLSLSLNGKYVPALLRLTELSKDTQPDLALGYITTVVSAEPKNCAAIITKAKLQERTGDSASALRTYRAALDLEPKNPDALAGMGTINFGFGDYEKAVEYLSQAIELKPDVAQYRFDKARAHERLDQAGVAVTEYKATVAVDAAFHRAWGALGFLHRESKPKEAMEYFDKAIALDAKNSYYYTAKGELMMKAGANQDKILDCFELAARFDPGNDELHHKLGTLLEEMGNAASAVKHYREAVSLKPNRPVTHYRLARLLMDTYPERAISHINTAIGLDVTNGEYLFLKGKILMELGRNEQALAALQKTLESGENAELLTEMADLLSGDSLRVALMYLNRAVESAAGNPLYLCTRAHLLYRMGQKDKAQAQYEALLKKNKDQHEALFGMARILAGKGDAGALGCFDRAIALEPDNAEYHAEKAAFLAGDSANYSQALAEYDVAIALNRQAWMVILGKAKLLDEHGDPNAAMEEYRRVLLVYPKSVDAAARMGALLSELSPRNALAYLDQAVRLDERNWRHYALRAKVHFTLGNKPAASDELRTALTLGGTTAEIYGGLAETLMATVPETALGYIRQALEEQPDNARYLLLCAGIHFALGNMDQAKEFYQKTAERDSKCHEALEKLAEIAYLARDPQCDEAAERAHVQKGDCPACAYLRARILEEFKQDIPSAIEFVNRSVSLEPENLAYREKLVELLGKKKAFVRHALEKHRLEKLRKKLGIPVEVPPPPAFETEDEAEPWSEINKMEETTNGK